MKWFTIISCLLVLGGCSSPNKIPDDVIGIEKMKLVMWDMIRACKLAENQFKRDSAKIREASIQHYQQVFDLYHITKDQFYKSYRYYEEHADKNKILMDSLSAYASRQRQELYKPVRVR